MSNDMQKFRDKPNMKQAKGFTRQEKRDVKKMLLEQQKAVPISEAFSGRPAISPRQAIRDKKYLCPCGKTIKVTGFETPDTLSSKCAEKCNTIIKIEGSRLSHTPTFRLKRFSS